MRFYTDYPLTQLGDIPYQLAPIREITIISRDSDNQYIQCMVEGARCDIRPCYVYTKGELKSFFGETSAILHEITPEQLNSITV